VKKEIFEGYSSTQYRWATKQHWICQGMAGADSWIPAEEEMRMS
jgi:hypothetical protein